ncbi:sulfotransferase family 2 domain-containing protein [Gloeobacter violaceus]|uniref:sulfotransferase family 2 domain-containing protein n=1 Tax=Gloeobacter violaceus TaxID=33072 RepID=UPI0013E8F3B6|nr:sulfotransferase family 2 domain-containing protein [Gloeobacter violaceus]
MTGRSNNQPQRPLVIFLHIPKTGGTTFEAILKRAYGEADILEFDLAAINDAEGAARARQTARAARRCSFIRGHFPMGLRLHESIARPCTYVTWLRDPLERMISEYHFIVRYPPHPAHEPVHRYKMTLKDYLLSEWAAGTDNYMTRFLCSQAPDAQDADWACSQAMLAGARANLDRFFPVVALMERFDESLLLLQSHFGWRLPLYVKENVTRDRPTLADLPGPTLQILQDLNRYDLSLYAHARGRFAGQLGALEPDAFNRRLRSFRLLNRTYSRVHTGRQLYRRLQELWCRSVNRYRAYEGTVRSTVKRAVLGLLNSR